MKSDRSDLAYFIRFDIANFYDTINLDLLERKIRNAIPSAKNEIVDLMFVFLRNWNRRFEGYGAKTVGLPQDETGDCSRLLANFYLQDYDRSMQERGLDVSGGGEYLRYADDQIIMTQEQMDAHEWIFNASIALHKIGLNINSGKVIEMSCREDFQYFWSFDYFPLLEDSENVSNINQAVRMFIEQINDDKCNPTPRPWKSNHVLRRIISLGIDKLDHINRRMMILLLFDKENMCQMKHWMFARIYACLDRDERTFMIKRLDALVDEVPYNGFQLNVRKFYRKNLPGKRLDFIDQRLERLSASYL